MASFSQSQKQRTRHLDFSGNQATSRDRSRHIGETADIPAHCRHDVVTALFVRADLLAIRFWGGSYTEETAC